MEGAGYRLTPKEFALAPSRLGNSLRKCKRDDGIARVTLCNPAKLNAMSAAMWRALRAAFDALNDERPGRTRVVLGRGRTQVSEAV